MTWLYMFLLMLFILNFIKKFFLMFLLYLEILILLTLYYTIEWYMNEKFFMYILIIAVCESVIGLSLLVKLNFDLGNQKMMFFDF